MGASTIKRLWTYSGFLLCLFLALTPVNANALPYAAANFKINWNTLQYTVTGGNLTITPPPNSASIPGIPDMPGSSSKAKVESDPDGKDNTTKLEEKIEAQVSTQASMTNDFATSSTESTIDTMMYGSVSAYGAPGIKYKAESEAKQWEYFTVAGDEGGNVTLELSIDYYLKQEIDGGGKAESEVKLALGKWWEELDKDGNIKYDSDGNAEIKTDEIEEKFIIEWKDLLGPNTEEFMGKLTAIYTFKDGDTGFMKATAKSKAEAYASPEPAPVPEPATMLLFGSGLIGLAGLRRKFKK